MRPGEAERRFGEYFEIERVVRVKHGSRGFATYLMIRKEEVMFIDKMETEAANLKDSLEVQN
jgi:hypothetical protein